jgi:hypothetical protein
MRPPNIALLGKRLDVVVASLLFAIAACSSPVPTVVESSLPDPALLPTVGPSPAPTPSPSQALVVDSQAGYLFLRPAHWHAFYSTAPIRIGPYRWLSSMDLLARCTLASPGVIPMGCVPGGRVFDGDVVIVFSRGVTIGQYTQRPTLLATADDDCTTIGGRAFHVSYGPFGFGACAGGDLGESLVREIAASVRKGQMSAASG